MSAERESTRPDPMLGRTLEGRYRIDALIAKGGMGRVYSATQEPLGRRVALKVLTAQFNNEDSPEFRQRFFLEASTCARLRHPNTVTVFDYGQTDDGVFFIAMELLSGRTLHRCIRDEVVLPLDRTLRIAQQVCRSLREAHGLGIVHRDLKPANVFLTTHGDQDEFVKLLDFGLVKELDTTEDLTRTGLFMGSPKYMSPEQIRGERVTPASDIYSLGVILFECLTGRVPFDHSTSMGILLAHLQQSPPRPSQTTQPGLHIPPEVDELILRCLEKVPDRRFQSMDEVLVAIGSVAAVCSIGLGHHATDPHGLSARSSAASAPAYVTNVSIPRAPRLPSDSASLLNSTASKGELYPPVLTQSQAPLFPRPKQRHRFSSAAIVAAVLTLSASFGAAFALRDRVEQERAFAVSVESRPPGATIRIGGQEFGTTPSELEIPRTLAAEGAALTLELERGGFLPVTVTRRVHGNRLRVVVSLPPRVPAAPSR